MNASWHVWWVLITGVKVGQKVALVGEVPKLVVGSAFDKVLAQVKGWQATFLEALGEQRLDMLPLGLGSGPQLESGPWPVPAVAAIRPCGSFGASRPSVATRPASPNLFAPGQSQSLRPADAKDVALAMKCSSAAQAPPTRHRHRAGLPLPLPGFPAQTPKARALGRRCVRGGLMFPSWMQGRQSECAPDPDLSYRSATKAWEKGAWLLPPWGWTRSGWRLQEGQRWRIDGWSCSR